MSEFDDLLAFVRVAETLSFSRAAERLQVTKSVVSRRIDRLERSMGGVTLLSRTTRGVSLTEAGREFEQRCRKVLCGRKALVELARRCHLLEQLCWHRFASLAVSRVVF